MFFWKRNKKKQEFVETRLGVFKKTQGGNNTNRMLYEAPVTWEYSKLDTNVYIFLDAEDPEAEKKGLQVLERILSEKELWDKKLKEYMADVNAEDDGLIHIWGSETDEEEPSPVTKEEFVSKLDLGSIRIHEDLSIEFAFPVDDMFTDHGMVVSVSENFEIEDCCLEG